MLFPPARSRDGFVTACQQLLALGAVLAVLTPAANVVNLDVVEQGRAPQLAAAHPQAARPQAARPRAARPRRRVAASTLPSAPVDARVAEYQLTAPSRARVAPGSLRARTSAGRAGSGRTVTSDVLPVTGYGTVGVTWSHDDPIAQHAVAVDVRMRDEGTWSGWTPIAYDADHGPDPASAEARTARRGTDALLVGNVDDVQVRVATRRAAPADLRLAVIAPGRAAATVQQRPATVPPAPVAARAATSAAAGGTSVPRPQIYTRAQWGADESMRDAGSLHYGTVSAGFVHHTVNANGYGRDEVPGILRSIYAYHVRSLGWSDIGYNYLVDRFGRIWEGRYGGIDRNPVGAHTLGYNDWSFAMSAIGNYDITEPSQAIVEAYGALFAWKLALNGVDASSTHQQVGPGVFQAINGHRDAGQTACPGRYLYARLDDIRRLATAAQHGAADPGTTIGSLDSDLLDDAHPDLVVRRRSDGEALVLPTGGLTSVGRVRPVDGSWSGWRELTPSEDLTGDGVDDVLARAADGSTAIAAGRADGSFTAPASVPGAPEATSDLVVAPGDVDGDGIADLLARKGGTSRLVAYLGDGRGGFRATSLGLGWARYDLVVAAGDLTGDGDPDLLVRDGDGVLSMRHGASGAGFAGPQTVPAPWTGSWADFSDVVGAGDLTGDGHPDLVVRRSSDRAGFVVAGRGGVDFGRGYGPLGRLASLSALGGGTQIGRSASPDLVGRRDGTLVRVAISGASQTREPVETGLDLSSTGVVLNVGDFDHDGHGDLVTRSRGTLSLLRGDGLGGFGAPRALASGMLHVRSLTSVGDVTGDGWADLVGREGDDWQVYPGHGRSALGAPRATSGLLDGRGTADLSSYRRVLAVADLRGKGRPDLVAVDDAGLLWLLPVTREGLGARRFLAEGMSAYDLIG